MDALDHDTQHDLHSDLETQVFSIPFLTLNLNAVTIERSMGYTHGAPPFFTDQISALLEEAPNHIELQGGYRIIPKDRLHLDKESISFDHTCFKTGKIIARGLRKSRDIAVFVATAGPGLDVWMKRYFDQGDMMAGYLINALGSETVELAADWLDARLLERVQLQGDNISDRYSPGYCGWSVGEQHALFSFLPPAFCGVRLTPSALMQPVKSVSGFVGIGPNVRRHGYTCQICTLENCFRRNTRRL
jgi:hypothetical protein